jgi:hypothetical protein
MAVGMAGMRSTATMGASTTNPPRRAVSAEAGQVYRAGGQVLRRALPSAQIDPGQDDQRPDDDSQRLPPAEARRPTKTHGIGECCDEDDENASADHDPRAH